MQNELTEALKTLFIGNIPEPLIGIEISFDEISSLIDNQGVKSTKQLNYAQLLEDVLILLSVHSKKGKPLTLQSLSNHQYFNRKGLKSAYYKVMQNKDIDVFTKVEITYFIRNFLQTTTKIYGIEMLHGQPEFIKELETEEVKFQEIANEFDTLMKMIDEDVPDQGLIKLSPYWNYSLEQLELLADNLQQAGFIDNAASFVQAFAINPQGICHYHKLKTSFMFLMDRIFKETDSYKINELCEFLSKRFTFNNAAPKTANARTLKETLRNIEPKTKDNPKYLGGDFAKLHQIHLAIFP